MELEKKDLGGLINAPVDTRHKLISEGRITKRKRPTQISLRLPAAQVEWLQRRVDGNANYVVATIMDRAIAELNDVLTTGEFNIDDFKS